MAERRTTPKEQENPAFQPGKPTPEDPRQNEPIHDPPVDPEHDDVERAQPARKDPADSIVFDETRPVG